MLAYLDKNADKRVMDSQPIIFADPLAVSLCLYLDVRRSINHGVRFRLVVSFSLHGSTMCFCGESRFIFLDSFFPQDLLLASGFVLSLPLAFEVTLLLLSADSYYSQVSYRLSSPLLMQMQPIDLETLTSKC